MKKINIFTELRTRAKLIDLAINNYGWIEDRILSEGEPINIDRLFYSTNSYASGGKKYE